MPQVKLSHLLSFSSQDEKNPASNLLKGDGFQKWLNSSSDRSGRCEAHFQLERACSISSIDIGTYNTATVEVKVGRSSWPEMNDYETILPAAIFMTLPDVRLNKHKVRLRMFNSEHLSPAVCSQQWDRVRIVCSQPYSREKFGLTLLKLSCDEDKHCNSHQQMVQQKPNTNGLVSPSVVEESKNTSLSQRSRAVFDIQKHFFGKQLSKDSFVENMKDKLLKISGSGEDGAQHDQAVPRNIKMVMAAVRSPKYKTYEEKPSPFQHKPSFGDEVESFLAGIDIKTLDLDTVKFSDLRHNLERRKARKLSKEEKKIFFEKAKHFVDEILDQVPNKREIAGKSVAPGQSSVAKNVSERNPSVRNTNNTVSQSVDISTSKAVVQNNGRFDSLTKQSQRKASKRTATAQSESSEAKQLSAGKKHGDSTTMLADIRQKRSHWLSKLNSPTACVNQPKILVISDDEETPPPRTLVPPREHLSSNSCQARDAPQAEYVDVACPICEQLFPDYMLPVHADLCAELVFAG